MELLATSAISSANGSPAIPSISRAQLLPASFVQQRFWFLDQFENEGAISNISEPIHLSGHLNVEALAWSINAIVQRHEGLRTIFEENDGQVIQRIIPDINIPLVSIDLQDLQPQEQEQEIKSLTDREAGYRFNLSHGPLLRILLLRLNDQEHILLFTIHHIVFDGWSFTIFMRELNTLYSSFINQCFHALPPLTLQYVDFAWWQRTWMQNSVLQQKLAYWKKYLADVSPLDLPTDFPRPPLQSYRSSQYAFSLPQELLVDLRKLCRKTGCTTYMVLLTIFQILLAHYSGQEDICVGSPVANRTRAELENIIGCFFNTVVIRSTVHLEATFLELLQHNRQI